MGYRELLPKRADLAARLIADGLAPEQVERALWAVASALTEWSDYFENRSRLTDNDESLQDEGASRALSEVVAELTGREDGRCRSDT